MAVPRKVTPLTTRVTPNVRRFSNVPSERIFESRNPIAGTIGNTYPGSFDFEIEKKTKQNVTQHRIKQVRGEILRARHQCLIPVSPEMTTRSDHGRKATRRIGT